MKYSCIRSLIIAVISVIFGCCIQSYTDLNISDESFYYCEAMNLCELAENMLKNPRTAFDHSFIVNDSVKNVSIGEIIGIIEKKYTTLKFQLGFQETLNNKQIVGGLYFFKINERFDGLMIFCLDSGKYYNMNYKTGELIKESDFNHLKKLLNAINDFKLYQFRIDNSIQPLSVPDAPRKK